MNARTPDQLADELGYSRAQVYAMLKRREIGFVRRPGGAYRILQQHIDQWVRDNECPAMPKAQGSCNEKADANGILLTEEIASARVRRISERRGVSVMPTSIASHDRSTRR